MNPSVGSEGTQLKIANLTPTPVGGLSLATAVFGLLLVGCPADDGNATATSEGETEDDEDSTDTEPVDTTTTTTMTATDTDTDTDPSDTDPPTTTETTGPTPEGLGCGITPTCDGGEFVGSLVFDSPDDVEEFAGYTSVTGWVQIIDVPDLVCTDFLACIETVGKDIEISNSPELESLQGFANVTTVENILLFNNASITSLAGFDSLTEVQIISIGEMPGLVEANGFPAVERISTSLSISENPVLESITGFANLIIIEDEINIGFNPVLTDLSGPSGLLALGGECIITNNATLCVSQAATVCGDLMKPKGTPPGSTANNDDSC
jgi:hypothetical protein